MTVIIVKRECDRHPGCYTLTDKCERCVTEDFHAAMDRAWTKFREDVRHALNADGEAEGPRAGDPTVAQLDEWFPSAREETP